MKQGRRAQKFIVPHWWTYVMWKMLNWRQSTKNTKVELYSEVILWKDDSGSYAVFTEQGSSASQMTAAKVMDIISRLPGCDGQAADAVSKFRNRKVQTFGFVCHDTNLGPVWKTQSFLLNDICMVILWQDYYGKGKLRRSYWSMAGRKFPNWECLFVHQKGLFLSVYVDDIKLAGKEQNLDPMWKLLNKEVDLGEPTSFLDHVYLGCTQRQCQVSKDIVDNYRTMFESRISAERTEKTAIPSKNFVFLSWSYDMEGHAKEICGAILWVGQQDDATTLQSTYSMHRWPPLQRRWNEICWRIVTSMLSNCSEMFVLGTNWEDLIFYGQ